MQFGRLLYVSLAAALVNFTVTLGLAFTGNGPDSMAWGAVASNAATGLGAHIARGRPAFLWPSLAEWRRVASFGGQSAVTSIINSVTQDANDLVLGRALGLAPVAFLSRAQGLVSLFTREILGAIRNVMFPAFAKLHRDGENTEQAYIRTVVVTTGIGWTFFTFLALFPLEVMRLLYGSQWDQSANLIPILALGGAAYCAGAFTINVIMAVGRIDLVTRFELCFQIPRFAILATVAVSTRSLEACAWVYAVAQLLYLPAVYFTKQHCLRTNWRLLLTGCGRSAVVTILSSIGALAISLNYGLGRSEPIGAAPLAGAVLLTIATWLGAIVFLRHPIASDPIFQRLKSKFAP
jgi:O-antigen/teichoic acid export membrane protein